MTNNITTTIIKRTTSTLNKYLSSSPRHLVITLNQQETPQITASFIMINIHLFKAQDILAMVLRAQVGSEMIKLNTMQRIHSFLNQTLTSISIHSDIINLLILKQYMRPLREPKLMKEKVTIKFCYQKGE